MTEVNLLIRKAKRSNETKLDLSSRDISFLPNDIYSLNKLEILNLSNNKIVSLDQKITELKGLKVLDLSNNSLIDLPKELLQLPELQALILQGNPLTKQFEPLLKPSPDVIKTLRVCFGMESSSNEQSTPSWFEGETTQVGKSTGGNNKTFGKMVEMETQLKNQQNKNKQLLKQLEKLSINKKKDSKNSFSVDVDAILQIQFTDLSILEQISMGGFSVIHRGHYKGLEVAVKKIFNPKISEQLLQELSNEINMLAKFRHPNIVLLIGICSTPPNLAIVTQYVKSGSLYDLVHKKRAKLTKQQRGSIIKQILSAVDYLHQHGIVHRDIKSHNFLIYENLTVKLCDFGLARHRSQLQQGPMQFSGTPAYMSQQLFQKRSYDQKVDIFALGTLIYQIYTNQIPYNKMDPADIKQKILKDSSLSNLNIDKPVLDLINLCRNQDASSRPTCQQLLSSPIW